MEEENDGEIIKETMEQEETTVDKSAPDIHRQGRDTAGSKD